MKTYHLDIYKNIHTHKEKDQGVIYQNVILLFSKGQDYGCFVLF